MMVETINISAAETVPTPSQTSRPVRAGGATTPMMVQYLEIKQANPGVLLFYRMGDFYEMFFEDARKAAAALDITLTKRGKHSGADIPMCGVPVHAADSYLFKLIKKGFRVAVCEQTEDPEQSRKRGSKSVVRREVVRLVTPGTITEDALLSAREHNYLAAVADAGGALGLAWLDVSTGAFYTQAVSLSGLPAALARIAPGELLVPERLSERSDYCDIFDECGEGLSAQPNARFNSESARQQLEDLFGTMALDAFGDFGRAEVSACGAVVSYVKLTQKGMLPPIQRPRRLVDGATLQIDAATRQNLELVQSLNGVQDGSLLSVVDRTVTGPGGRLLAARISSPLTDVNVICARHDAVSWFVAETGYRDKLRTILREASDMERALSRLTVGRGGPRDLAAIRDGLAAATELNAVLGSAPGLPAKVEDKCIDLSGHRSLLAQLSQSLGDELPLLTRDGGFIRSGYSSELDELRVLRDESRSHMAGLQAHYSQKTGIQSLKIRHNNVLGFFIDVTSAQAEKIPVDDDSPFIHRQTLSSAVRYTTVELGELEGKLAQAGDQALALEQELFQNLVRAVTAWTKQILLAAAALADLDVASALATLAVERRYVRPIVDDSFTFNVEGGRHPVVEPTLKPDRHGAFIANDCNLEHMQRLWLVTGPNMAGKSTFLRQNALMVVLAQAGSFVPADKAHFGVVDRLFSRVGAADDIARGRSTFMVEMVETANILNQATERSLVILDEIGRGTATFDGLSIAWATLEHLHGVNRCRTLFATHFHELTSLTSRLDAMACRTMRVKEWDGDVVFLHEVVSGAADQSYGVYVAKLAGLPPSVIGRAREILSMLEEGGQGSALARLSDDLPLFSANVCPQPTTALSDVEAALSDVNPDVLSPREALELLYQLKGLSQD